MILLDKLWKKVSVQKMFIKLSSYQKEKGNWFAGHISILFLLVVNHGCKSG